MGRIKSNSVGRYYKLAEQVNLFLLQYDCRKRIGSHRLRLNHQDLRTHPGSCRIEYTSAVNSGPRFYRIFIVGSPNKIQVRRTSRSPVAVLLWRLASPIAIDGPL